MPTVEGDFYEDDEPIEKILAIWENSPKTLTGPPPAGWTPSANVVVLDREVYSMGQAARLLGIQPATPRRWIDGYTRSGIVYPPVIRPEQTGYDSVYLGRVRRGRLSS